MRFTRQAYLKPETVTDEMAYEYMKCHWYHDEDWTDFNIIADAIPVDVELMADYLVNNAGCIDSTQCYPESRDIEQHIEELAVKWRRLPAKEKDKRHMAYKNNLISSFIIKGPGFKHNRFFFFIRQFLIYSFCNKRNKGMKHYEA